MRTSLKWPCNFDAGQRSDSVEWPSAMDENQSKMDVDLSESTGSSLLTTQRRTRSTFSQESVPPPSTPLSSGNQKSEETVPLTSKDTLSGSNENASRLAKKYCRERTSKSASEPQSKPETTVEKRTRESLDGKHDDEVLICDLCAANLGLISDAEDEPRISVVDDDQTQPWEDVDVESSR